MCGILAVHGLDNPSNDRARFIALSKRLRHRGPDWSGCFVGRRSILAHERLAIVGVGACQYVGANQWLIDPLAIQILELSPLLVTMAKLSSLSMARSTITLLSVHQLVPM